MVHFRLTGGHAHDCPQAIPLLAGITTERVIADKGYDSSALVSHVESRGAVAVIPSTRTRKVKRWVDFQVYCRRNLIERLFCRIKQFRRIATRYDKLARRFASFVLIVCACVWPA